MASDAHVAVRPWPFVVLLLFVTFLALPVALGCYAIAPAWCLMYGADPDRLPPHSAGIIFATYPIAAAIGFGLAALIGSPRARLRLAGLPLLAILALAVFFPRRLFYVGTMADWTAGSVVPLWRSEPELMAVALGGASVCLIAFVALVRRVGAEQDHRWGEVVLGAVPVSILRAEASVEHSLRSSLAAWDGLDQLARTVRKKGGPVILKPNLGGGSVLRPGTCTPPDFIIAAARIVRSAAPKARLIVMESDMIFWWDMNRYLARSTYKDILSAEKIDFINPSRPPYQIHDFGGRLGVQEIPALLSPDATLVDLPVPKTHAYFRLSGAVKNLFGLLPARNKILHYHMRRAGDWRGQIFLDLYRNFPPDIVMVDGRVGTEGHGPLGSAKPAGFVLTSPDAVAADISLCEIMGFRPEGVPYLRPLVRAGAGPLISFSGLSPDAVRPPTAWRRTSPWTGLPVNLVRILRDHAALRAAGRKPPQ
ncbi:MAG: DUF362 domain-containing protein [Nitrospirae bacterium]|nr:DUF362 domain-containing protein [Nitrospirota bacterium]